MDQLLTYDDSMDVDNLDNPSTSTDDASSIVNPFRIKSLLLASFPWFTVITMVSSKLVECLGGTREEHPAFVSHLFNRSTTKVY